MTHDELRDYIDKFDAAGMVNEPAVKALRAVLELHKPIHNVYPNGNDFTECSHCNNGCWGCDEWMCDEKCDCKCHQAGNEYPCPTIQAIEKELE